MQFQSMVERVLDIVQDPSIDESEVKDLLNEGIEHAAAVIPVPLPSLETTEEVDTDTSLPYVDLPEEYHRDLYFCFNTTLRRRVIVQPSFELFSVKYPTLDESMNVMDVAVRGLLLYYQGIPVLSQTLRIHFFQRPPLLVDNEDEPTCLPNHLHRKLLVSYACKELFNKIEDGVDGIKVNANFYGKEWEEGKKALIAWVGPRSRDPVLVTDVMSPYFVE